VKHHPVIELQKLSPFWSIKLDYWEREQIEMPEIYHLYQPHSAFVGTKKQCHDWIHNYLDINEINAKITNYKHYSEKCK